MKIVLLAAAAALVLAAGCLPHSAAVGQTAAPVAVGGAEVGMSMGVAQTRMTTVEAGATPGAPASEDSTTQTSLPSVESNLLYGLSETLGLNLHASSAGIQPGVKVSLVRGPGVHVAVLPAFAIGTFRTSDDDGSADAFNSTTFLIGGRVLVSSDAGAYGAVGYDFQRTAVDELDAGDAGTRIDLHLLTGAIGYDLDAGRGLHVRPEMAVLYGMAGTTTAASSDPTTPGSRADVASLTLFPSLTVAVTTN